MGSAMRDWRAGLMFGLAAASAQMAAAGTLETIRAENRLSCGVVAEADDDNPDDVHGNLSKLEGEICRAVALAVLSQGGTLDLHSYPNELGALNALKSGEVRLAVGVTPGTQVAIQFGVNFGPPVFYDALRALTSVHSGIADIAALRDQLVCAMDLSEAELSLRDDMAARKIPFALMSHSEQGEMDAAVAVRRCEAGVATESRLASSRANFHARTSDFVFVPGSFGMVPVAPAYAYGDQAFGLAVDWTVYALIEAEALGVTHANVGEAVRREDVRAQRLLGRDFATAQALGLAHDWAAVVIAKVGNYGEVFERTVGGPLHLDRGVNALWTDGGLLRPMPMR